MTNPSNNLSVQQPVPARIQNFLGILLLLTCGLLIAGRAQIHEGMEMNLSLQTPAPLSAIAQGGSDTMLIFAGALLGMGLIWLAAQLASGLWTWRKTGGLGIAFLCFLIAAVASCHGASNRYAALVMTMTLLSQLVLALLLIQLVNTPEKVRIILAIIAATGVIAAYRCWEQYRHEFPQLLQMLQNDPNELLRRQGLLPGTYLAHQYIARIKSKDVSGFFTISNTMASFFILSLTAAAAIVSEKWTALRQFKTSQKRIRFDNVFPLLAGIILLLIQLAGLLLTQSKGAIAAFVFGWLLLLILWSKGNFFQRHWKKTLIAALVAILIAAGMVIGHGIHHGRLPGNSLWVRWQYWTAGAKMISDHWLSGVGPGNFGSYYPQYIQSGAVEIVQDPHCLFLSIWSQWGLLGFLGLLAGIALVVIRCARPTTTISRQLPPAEQGKLFSPFIWAIITAAGILLIRYFNSHLQFNSPQEKQAVLLVSFLIPAVLWIIAFLLLLMRIEPTDKENRQTIQSPTVLILGCGLAAFLIHNTIDFAIFHPGVGTCFFAIVGVMIAAGNLKNQQAGQKPMIEKKLYFGKALSVGIILLTLIAATGLLKTMDRWNPAIPREMARENVLKWVQGQCRQESLFLQAVTQFQQTIERDPANYQNHQLVSELYLQAAGIPEQKNSQTYQNLALRQIDQALQLYPTNPHLLVTKAQLLVRMNQIYNVMPLLEQALSSDQAHIQQQEKMYPDIQPVSLLSADQKRWIHEVLKKLKALEDCA